MTSVLPQLKAMIGMFSRQWERIARTCLPTEEAGARACVLIALVFVVIINLPMLAVGTVFGSDDWAWSWVARVQGAAAIQQYMIDASHPGFGPVLNLFFLFSGAGAARFARAFAIAFHLANGWLLWRIFIGSRSTPAFAAMLAVLYLMAPYSSGLHSSLAHAQYDFFIFCYLASILIVTRNGVVATIAAVVAMVVGLSIETLIAIEPLRWYLLYRTRGGVRARIRSALPFLGVIVLFVLIRVTILVPTGEFVGYNAVKHLTAAQFLIALFQHLEYFAALMEPLRTTALLVRYDSKLFVLLLLAVAAAIALAFSRAGDGPSNRKLAIISALGAIVLIAGTLPYGAVGRVLNRYDFDMGFAVASQFGALILIVVAIHLLRFRVLRVVALASMVFVFASLQIQYSKWMLYEQLVIADFHRQLVPYLAISGPQIIVVTFKPPTKEFLYLNRPCLSSYDNNASLDLSGERHGSFVFDKDCGAMFYDRRTDCRIVAFDHARACPVRRGEAEFVVTAGMDRYVRFRFADPIHRALSGAPFNAGQLVLLDAVNTPVSKPAAR